jgi:RNA polymerase sigma-70 factor (ECF subfamily)
MISRRPVDPDELLTHAAGVRSLAHALVADVSSADDVVQETWRVALERGVPRNVQLGAWLAGIVRRIAHGFGRGEARRRARERAGARDEALSSTAELCDRAALHRELVEAVLELGEPTRSAILLRYFEGLPPRDIAVRQNLSLDAVKSRLARGLAQLRKRMALDDERNAGAWLALLGMRAPRAIELARPTVLGVAVKASSSLVASLAAGAVVVALCAFWFVARRNDALSPALAKGLVASTTAPPATTEDAQVRLAAVATAPHDDPIAAESAATTSDVEHRLRGRVVDEAGRPIVGAHVQVQFDPHRGRGLARTKLSDGLREVDAADSDTNGDFSVRADRDQRCELLVGAAGFGQRRLFDCCFDESVVVVALSHAGRLSGEITRAANGASIAGAEIHVIYRDGANRSWTRETTSDARGHYDLSDLHADHLEITIEAADLESLYFQSVELAAGELVQRDFALEDGEVVEGRVIDAVSRQSIEGARVGNDWVFRNAVFTDSAGAFRLRGAESGQGTLRVAAEAKGYACDVLSIRSDQLTGIEISLQPEHRAVGRVLDPVGWPAKDAEVYAFGGKDRVVAITGADGRFELGGLSPMSRHVLCVIRAGSAERVIDFPPTESDRASIDFGDINLHVPSTVTGHVLAADGSPVEGATVEVYGCNSDRAGLALVQVADQEYRVARREYRTDASGRFVCTDLARGSYWFGAGRSGFAFNAEARLWVEEDSASEVELHFPGGQHMSGRVVDPSGAAVGHLRITLYAKSDDFYSLCSARTGSDGRFDIAGLPEGSCSLEIEAFNPWDSREIPQFQWDNISTSATDLLLTVPEVAYISGVVIGADGQPTTRHANVQVKEPGDNWGGRLPSTRADEHGRFRLLLWRGATVELQAYVYDASGGTLTETGALANVAAGATDVVIRMRPR